MTYSAGFVDNFLKPDDYAKQFIDINAGYSYGVDHCFDPTRIYESTTRATCISFGQGFNFGVGYDYYFAPWTIAKWGGK